MVIINIYLIKCRELLCHVLFSSKHHLQCQELRLLQWQLPEDTLTIHMAFWKRSPPTLIPAMWQSQPCQTTLECCLPCKQPGFVSSRNSELRIGDKFQPFLSCLIDPSSEHCTCPTPPLRIWGRWECEQTLGALWEAQDPVLTS